MFTAAILFLNWCIDTGRNKAKLSYNQLPYLKKFYNKYGFINMRGCCGHFETLTRIIKRPLEKNKTIEDIDFTDLFTTDK